MRWFNLFFSFVIVLFIIISSLEFVSAELSSIKAHCQKHESLLDNYNHSVSKFSKDIKENGDNLEQAYIAISLSEKIYHNCYLIYEEKCLFEQNRENNTNLNADSWKECAVLLKIKPKSLIKPSNAKISCLFQLRTWTFGYEKDFANLCEYITKTNKIKFLND